MQFIDDIDTMSEYTDSTYVLNERKDFIEEILMALRSGDLEIRNGSNESTFRCPFCPNRKKQSFLYKDILQHSEAMARGRTRGTSEQGKHSALVTYFSTDLAQLAAPLPPRAQKRELKAPPDDQLKGLKAVDLLLCPWTMVVQNLQRTMDENTKTDVGPSAKEVKSCFSSYQPKKVDVIWGPKGHSGIGIITFPGDFEGWKNAQALERWFTEREHGRRDWEKERHCNLLVGTGPYGWLARKEDYQGRKQAKEDHLVAKFLQGRGPLELKDIGMVGDDLKVMHEQRLQHFVEELKERRSDFLQLVDEVERAKRNAENMIARLEEKHKQELEEMTAKAQISTQERIVRMRAHNMALQSSMEKLLSRCHELREKEKIPKTQGGKFQLEQAKRENQRKLDIVNQQAEVQKNHQAAQMVLIKKHERQVDYSNKKLRKLQEKLGDEVVKTVIQALEELEEFNSCGRYPVSRIWNANEGRIANLKELIEYLVLLLNQALSVDKKIKRARLNANRG